MRKFILAVCLLCASAANAGVTVDLFGSGTYSMATGSPTPTAALGYPGGGLNLNIKFLPRLALELGGQYLTRVNSIFDVAQTTTYAQGNLGLKLYLLRFLLLDVGGFTDYYLTNPQSLKLDYGAFGSLTFEIPFSLMVAFMIKGQYNYNLVSHDYSSGTITPHDVIASVGFTFGLNLLAK